MLKFLQRLISVMVVMCGGCSHVMTVQHFAHLHMWGTCTYNYGRQAENVIENIGCIVILHAYSVNSCQNLPRAKSIYLRRGQMKQMSQGEALIL